MIGFTLLEMMVVISLISLTLVFAIPRFRPHDPVSDLEHSAQTLFNTIRFLKDAAMTRQTDYTLYIDLDRRRYWAGNAIMTEEAVENAAGGSKAISDAIVGIRVIYADKSILTSGIAPIQFFKQGYSSMARIHLIDRQSAEISILVEPFLSTPRYVTARQ